MGVDNPKERTEVFGKMKGQKRKKMVVLLKKKMVRMKVLLKNYY